MTSMPLNWIPLLLGLSASALVACAEAQQAAGALRQRGSARLEVTRPPRFPHRIWAACDFESRTHDYGWFGTPEKTNIPRYPGNATALRAAPGPYQNFSAVMTGINPVPGPRMGKVNKTGTSRMTVQIFDFTDQDNRHLHLTKLQQGSWQTLYLDFTRDAKRNDGSDTPFAAGHVVDDLFFFVEGEGGAEVNLLLDEVVLFDAGR
jgi:hypothetical protein